MADEMKLGLLAPSKSSTGIPEDWRWGEDEPSCFFPAREAGCTLTNRDWRSKGLVHRPNTLIN